MISKKLAVKKSLDQEKKQIGSLEKGMHTSSQKKTFITSTQTSATSRRNIEGIQNLPPAMEMFPGEFIGGFFQGMLNADAPAPPHLMQIFSRELNNINDEIVLTILAKCDARVSVCYGCSFNFKINGQGPQPPFDFIVIKKFRREYYNQGKKCLAAPSNAYFHAFCDHPFFQPFECIQRKYLAFNVAHMKIHNSLIDLLTPKHLVMLRNFQLFQFLY